MGKISLFLFGLLLTAAAHAQTTFGGNAQHTAIYGTAAQRLNAIHWTASVDLNNQGALAHYGAPLITPANTIFAPVKTGINDGFRIDVFNAANGTMKYSLATDYTLPAHGWIPAYQPVLATSVAGTRLYYPGAGGTVNYIDNVDAVGHGAPVRQVFYTTLSNYFANVAAFNTTVFINTPLTADSKGNVFFGFRVDGMAPAPLSTSQSGFVRIDPAGNATYVLAAAAAGDANADRDSHNSAPALSNDESTLYVVAKSSTDYGYLLGLDATTLATKYKVLLKDPRNNHATNALITDLSTASPMVGPDNDVYFGVLGSPFNGLRGFMLHFSGDLSVEKTPGGFGWDNTAALVPASMVPSYAGTSAYLLFTKYNNYASGGTDNTDGVNRIALLDPNATEIDAHPSSNGLPLMREVLTVAGPQADPEHRSPAFPFAVREWCINTAAVNPATNSVFMPSEDGHLYRWNLATNSLDQFLQLGPGIFEAYVPTIIGPDGQVFTLSGATLSALGALDGVDIALTSSVPDVRTGVAGQSITFTVAVTHAGMGPTPTGTVTLTDTTYAVPGDAVLVPTTTTLATNLPLNGSGVAIFTTSALTADNHFITATYSGDANFGAGSSSLIQFVHAGGTTTTLSAVPNPGYVGLPVTLTAMVAPAVPASGTPTGMVTFREGNVVLGQLPQDGSGAASLVVSGLAEGTHAVSATYASDSEFTTSIGNLNLQVMPAPPLTLDVDLNTNYEALTDGLLVLRYLFGFTGAALTDHAIGAGAGLADPVSILARLTNLAPALDIDGDGKRDALTDGLLLIRYLSGLRGAALVNGALGDGATRTTPELIEPYIQSLLP